MKDISAERERTEAVQLRDFDGGDELSRLPRASEMGHEGCVHHFVEGHAPFGLSQPAVRLIAASLHNMSLAVEQ